MRRPRLVCAALAAIRRWTPHRLPPNGRESVDARGLSRGSAWTWRVLPATRVRGTSSNTWRKSLPISLSFLRPNISPSQSAPSPASPARLSTTLRARCANIHCRAWRRAMADVLPEQRKGSSGRSSADQRSPTPSMRTQTLTVHPASVKSRVSARC